MRESELAATVAVALVRARSRLLEERDGLGHWTGELSSSALSTATASFALALVSRKRPEDDARLAPLVAAGINWLASNANEDGGWGDTTASASNLPTTCLVWAALGFAERSGISGPETVARARERAERWIAARAGGLERDALTQAIITIYGQDRTFSAPILTMCTLAGCLGDPDDSETWRDVPQLPFELAALPRSWFAKLGLQVVSYALPALIAIGLVRHVRSPSRFSIGGLLRDRTRERTLRLLTAIQPSSGGFLEATPLTSFVTMSLAGGGLASHEVTGRCVEFLERSAREDGSWPIDTDLATWVTTLAVNALAESDAPPALRDDEREAIREWLLGQQYREMHPYTRAAPGGWAWTDLPGGVPDADDTPGALLALRALRGASSAPEHQVERLRNAARAGLSWLLGLQNRDGGIPTFCRGWGRLPFDRSSPDLTAHAVRALRAWQSELGDARLERRVDRAAERCIDYLERTMREDGSWIPLWFGSEHVEGFENPTYGTARVVSGLRAAGGERARELRLAGARWLLAAQNDDGGWGGARGAPSSVEETSLALDALADGLVLERESGARAVLERGANHLARAIEGGALERPSPIGFYFANLWYHEKLYPIIFATGALGRVREVMERESKHGGD